MNAASLARKTNDQLISGFDRLLRRINKAFAGGTSLGVDLPTMRTVTPDLYNDYIAYRTEGRRRKQAGLV